MSFSFSVPQGPSADFADSAAKALEAYKASLADNDYMLSQFATGLADEAVALATEAVGKMPDGTRQRLAQRPRRARR